ncbi:MAG TPA: hypothetical protein VII38_11850 [Polyangia bacterium]
MRAHASGHRGLDRRGRVAVARSIAVALALLLFSAPARAAIPDVFGLGSEESALAGATAARVRDFTAGYWNPAGLALVAHPEASLGVLGFGSQLQIRRPGDTRIAPIADPFAILVGGAAPIPFTGVLDHRLFIGIALAIVPEALVRVISHSPEEPFYPLYDNRTQRLVVLPALAVRLPRGLSLGIGLNYLAGLDGQVAASPGATRAIEARVDESIVSHLGVNAGVRWQATGALALALVYRQEFAIPFRTVSHNDVAGQPIDLDVDAEGLYTPHELVLGSALTLPHRLTASLDLEWSHWSAFRGPFVTVSSELPLVGAIAAEPPKVAFTDTFGVRGGLEWLAVARRLAELRLRAGYGFETQAAPASQPGVTNLLDGPKHRIAAGAGVRLAILGGHLRLDVHGQLDVLQSTTLTKKIAPAGSQPDPASALSDELPDDPAKPATLGTQISNPGYPSISSGGFAWSLGAMLTVEYK